MPGFVREPYVKVLYTEYYVRRKGPTTYELTKFVNGSDTPQAVYTLQETREGILCDCFGGVVHNRYHCKHVWVVPEFQRLERANRFVDLYPCCYMEAA